MHPSPSLFLPFSFSLSLPFSLSLSLSPPPTHSPPSSLSHTHAHKQTHIRTSLSLNPSLSQVRHIDAKSELSDDEIHIVRRNAVGVKADLFVPNAAFETLVKRLIRRLEDPAGHCVRKVSEQLKVRPGATQQGLGNVYGVLGNV